MFPYGNGSGSVELSQRQLHVKERHPAEDGHQDVGNEEGTCGVNLKLTFAAGRIFTPDSNSGARIRIFNLKMTLNLRIKTMCVEKIKANKSL